MGSSMSHPVGLAADPVGLAAVPVGLAAALAAKDDYMSRPCSVPHGFYEVRYEKVEIHKSKSPIIAAELERIFNVMHQMKDISTWRIPTRLLVIFVGNVESAHQYFDLKKYMREESSFIMHDSNLEDIVDRIVRDNKKHNRFNKVWEGVIKVAVEEYISELKEEHSLRIKYDFPMYLKRCESIDWKNKFRFILESENIIEKFPDISLEEIKDGFEHDSNLEDNVDRIVRDNKKHNRFNKVWEEVIKAAVEEYISELKEEHSFRIKYDFLMYLKRCESIDLKNKFRFILEIENIIRKFPDLGLEEIKDGFERYRYESRLVGPVDDEASYQSRLEKDYESELHLLRKMKMEDVDGCAAVNKVYALVLEKREDGCALDQNPEVEVAKMIMSDMSYAQVFFEDGPMENLLYQARTVMVRNVPFNASKLDVKELFMHFGKLEHVAMKSGDKYQTAYVTFEYPEGVDDALLLQRPTVLNVPVYMKPFLRSEERQAVSAHLRSEEAKIRRAEECRELSEALMKYAALNRCYFPNQ